METRTVNEVTLGKRICEFRGKKRFSQEELANQVGVVTKTICNYEKASSSPTIKTINKIADVLEVDLNTLLFDDVAPQGQEGGTQNTDVTNALTILAKIDAFREEGDMHLSRKFGCFVNDAYNALERLEVDELLMVLKKRVNDELQLEELSDDEFNEYIERIMDAALYGQDLYEIDMKTLKVFADENDIRPKSHSIGLMTTAGKWTDHDDIIPKMREKFRDTILAGRDPFGTDNNPATEASEEVNGLLS